jgi:hypothetical protein
VDTASIVREIDAEIARLTSARKILGSANSTVQTRQRARSTSNSRTGAMKAGSGLTAAGRKRLSDLMKKRWAERRKKAAAKSK